LILHNSYLELCALLEQTNINGIATQRNIWVGYGNL
jgi:hypothetical protein